MQEKPVLTTNGLRDGFLYQAVVQQKKVQIPYHNTEVKKGFGQTRLL